MSNKKFGVILFSITAILTYSSFILLKNIEDCIICIAFIIPLLPLTLLFLYLLGLFILANIHYYGIQRFIHFFLEKYGQRTIGTVIESQGYSDDGDSCIRGLYSFTDSFGKEHQGKFRICIHWPNSEQWGLVTKGYAFDAHNPVLYLKYFPLIHKMLFPI